MGTARAARGRPRKRPSTGELRLPVRHPDPRHQLLVGVPLTRLSVIRPEVLPNPPHSIVHGLFPRSESEWNAVVLVHGTGT